MSNYEADSIKKILNDENPLKIQRDPLALSSEEAKDRFDEFASRVLQGYTMPQESVEELLKTREEAIEIKRKT